MDKGPAVFAADFGGYVRKKSKRSKVEDFNVAAAVSTIRKLVLEGNSLVYARKIAGIQGYYSEKSKLLKNDPEYKKLSASVRKASNEKRMNKC